MLKEKDFYQISLKLLLKNPTGKHLALKAVDDGTFAGFYDLPGGRIDTDEFYKPFSEIINREVGEEIGSNVEYILNEAPVAAGRKLILAKHSGSLQKDIHVLYLFFKADYISGDINLSYEHKGFDWLDLSKIDLANHFKEGLLDGVRMCLNS